MAYGLKYELKAISDRFANPWLVKIYFDGYAGGEVIRDVPLNAFIFKKEKGDAAVNGTSLDISIRGNEDFDFLEFYTTDPKHIKVELYKGTTIKWTGFVQPEQYNEPYKPAPFNAAITASDGIAYLKNRQYYPAITGNKTELAILKYILDSTGAVLAYSTSIWIHEINHDNTYSPLSQTYIDDKTFYGDYCYDVIAKILTKYNAICTQVRNRWFIYSRKDLDKTRILYTSAGAYEGTEAVPTAYNLGLVNESGVSAWPVKDPLQATNEPSYKDVTIKEDLDYNGNVLKNGKFDGGFLPLDNYVEDWISIGFLVNNTLSRLLDDKVYWLKMSIGSNYNGQPVPYISQSVSINKDIYSPAGFVFSVSVAIVHYFVSSSNITGSYYTTTTKNAKIRVRFNDGTTNYYLTTNGWSTTSGFIVKAIDGTGPQLQEVEIKVNVPYFPGNTGTLTVELYAVEYDGSLSNRTSSDPHIAIYWKLPRAFFLKNEDGEYDKSQEETFDLNENALISAEDININTGDVPLFYSAGYKTIINGEKYYKAITKLANGNPTSSWTIYGKALSQRITAQLLRILKTFLPYVRLRLNGTIVCNDLDHTALLLDEYNNNKKFEIEEVSYDLWADEANVNLIEYLGWVETERYLSVDNTPISFAYDDGSDDAVIRTISTTLSVWTVNNKPDWINCAVFDASDNDITSTPASWTDGCKLKVWPASSNTASTRSGYIYIGDTEGAIVTISISQVANVNLTATIEANNFEITRRMASISVGTTTLNYAFTPWGITGTRVMVMVYKNSEGLIASEEIICTEGVWHNDNITVSEAHEGDLYTIELYNIV